MLRTKLFRLIYEILHRSGAVLAVRRFLIALDRRSDNPASNNPLTSDNNRRLERGFLVFYYHRVNNQNDPYFEATPAKMFGEQIEYLSKHYRILPLNELVSLAKEGKTPDNAVAITFDDGYRDNLTDAFPILSKRQAPATIYLPTKYIGTGEIPLWDKLSYTFKKTRKKSLEISIWGNKNYSLYTDTDKIRAMRDVQSDIHKCRTEDHKNIWIERVAELLDVRDFDGFSEGMLNWDEVKFMAGDGIDFGAHTVTHPDLTKLAPDDAMREIAESKAELERRLERGVSTFAYPRGDFNRVVRDLVEKAGFESACVTVMGANKSGFDPFAIKRITSIEAPISSFAALIEWLRYFPRGRKNQDCTGN